MDNISPEFKKELYEINILMQKGHTNHCAKRQIWGDGECECKKIVEQKTNNNFIVVLKYLLIGGKIKFGNEEFSIYDGVFGVSLLKNNDEKLHGRVDMDLTEFIEICSKLKKDEIAKMNMDITLNMSKIRKNRTTTQI